MTRRTRPSDPQWYKEAVIYELHVRAFHDANQDGIGDFAGLTEKLDYLRDLGVTALWLLPFYPSPLRDDGYDISDYTGIHSSYGTLKDFRRFLREAHRRDLRVITELVINHTSSEHPWFQRARRAPPGSVARQFYVWSERPDRYRKARIIFKDFETSNWAWDPVAGAYFWHRFYSHQPDLNFDNPSMRRALFKVLDFWLEMGVDGMRLDAVPYLYEREGTHCENLEETHAFLRELRAHVDRRFEGRMLLAEANQWPEDAAAYFGAGDECHMNFHFPLMPRLFMAVHLEDSRPIVDILDHTPQVHESCQWATFLRNHDELTLEMVTDEDRDYMYRVYADDPRARINLGIRRRLAPLLKLRRKIELMNGLLFSLPGTPVIYYGDEIGMGDNIYLGDRGGVRTPMQWSGDRNAGFSRGNPQTLYLPPITDPEYHYEAVNVEAQERNPSSLLSWMRRMIHLRRRYPVFGRGSLEFIETNNPRMLAFTREYQDSRVLVVANLSRFMQYGNLRLDPFAGTVPMEMFGHNEFPPVGRSPYFLSLGPHGFCWFLLKPATGGGAISSRGELRATGTWRDVFVGARETLERLLPDYLPLQRWFRSKSLKVRSVSVVDSVSVPGADAEIAVVRVDFQDHESESYVLPLTFSEGADASRIQQERPSAIVTPVVVETPSGDHHGVLYDATAREKFAQALLHATRVRLVMPGRSGELRCVALRELRQATAEQLAQLSARTGSAEQSNTSVLFGDRFIMKVFRRVEEGTSPDVEVGRFLTEQRAFAQVPALAGFIEYRASGKPSASVAMVQRLVQSEGDGWAWTLQSLATYTDRCLKRKGALPSDLDPEGSLLDRSQMELPSGVTKLLGEYLPRVELLGRRTAELHLALASDAESPSFRPEPLTAMHQRSLYEAARARLNQTLRLAEKKLDALPRPTAELARDLISRKKEIDHRFRRVLDQRLDAQLIRCHGDYHLGQVLVTASDFAIIDFEGEPARPLGERRLKKSPILDVAGMLRSFHYAAVTALRDERLTRAQRRKLEPWLLAWHGWTAAVYLRSYLVAIQSSGLVPSEPEPLRTLLDFFIMDKCLYEIGYEVNNRPAWVAIPLEGLRTLLASAATRDER
ncbi:MAG: maltose alpha-D-glucosyltransferase [Polyangiaceae bacterium]|nr:maltose alpha-D-glucosyltransferase [Polyangiaceae bacterium]